MPRITVKKESNMEFYEALAKLQTKEECFLFFQDICSPTERTAIEQRYEVAKMLLEGHVYADISEKTHASSATISRVNRVLLEGTGVLQDLLAEESGDGNEDPE